MIFKVQNGSFSYNNGREILRDISFSINEGQILSVIGPNGIGKTTLLRCTMGMLSWKKGETLIDGKNLLSFSQREIGKQIAYVPQARSASVLYKAEDMVLLGRSSHIGFLSQPSAEDREIADYAMEQVGITKLKGKLLSQMSGGEVQMVLIARALAAQPKIIVLDEPESNLDFKNQLIILTLLRKLADKQGVCCIFNTHYPAHALRFSDKALLLYNGGSIFGDSNNIISEENMKRAFGVNVHIESFVDNGRKYQSVVPLSIAMV